MHTFNSSHAMKEQVVKFNEKIQSMNLIRRLFGELHVSMSNGFVNLISGESANTFRGLDTR